MTITYRDISVEDDGWIERVDLWLLRMGRYCDRCSRRIATEEHYFTRDANPHRSKDYCATCIPVIRAHGEP
jgi:hypothetical protein